MFGRTSKRRDNSTNAKKQLSESPHLKITDKKRKNAVNEECGDSQSGSVANTASLRFRFPLIWSVRLSLGVCLSGGAKRRHLYQD